MENKFTLDDTILRESLEAVGKYQQSKQKNQFVIVGGIANQLYSYTSFPGLIRPTTDLDIDSDKYINYATFRDVVAREICDSLKSYKPAISDQHHIFQIEIKDEDEVPLLIHSYKFSQNGYEKNKKSLERQVSNANFVKVPKSDCKVLVVRPEEILYSKLDRLKKLEKGGKIPEELKKLYDVTKNRDWISFADEDLKQWLSSLKIEKLMLPTCYDRGEKEFKKALDHYRVSKDFYDVSLLITLALQGRINIVEDYYDEILRSESIEV